MKLFRLVSVLLTLCHSSISLITLPEANQSHLDYLQHRVGFSPGEDEFFMPQNPRDRKLFEENPKLYKTVKDPVQKRFQFTLDDAITTPDSIEDKNEIISNSDDETVPKTTTIKPIIPPTESLPKRLPPKDTRVPKSIIQKKPIFNLNSGLSQIKKVLGMLPKANDMLVSSAMNKRRRYKPGRYVPYFTLPKYIPPNPYQHQPRQRVDPNAGLESFDNFEQDYTKAPDTHNNPPFTTPFPNRPFNRGRPSPRRPGSRRPGPFQPSGPSGSGSFQPSPYQYPNEPPQYPPTGPPQQDPPIGIELPGLEINLGTIVHHDGPEHYQNGPAPEHYRDGPEHYHEGPEHYHEGPEQYHEGPEQYHDGPEQYYNSPEQFRHNEYPESPNTIHQEVPYSPDLDDPINLSPPENVIPKPLDILYYKPKQNGPIRMPPPQHVLQQNHNQAESEDFYDNYEDYDDGRTDSGYRIEPVQQQPPLYQPIQYQQPQQGYYQPQNPLQPNAEQEPTDRGVKTRLFTKVTDVTTTGGDDEPVQRVVKSGPYIYNEHDLQRVEEDEIEAEIPNFMDISRQDYEDDYIGPTADRIDWNSGPYDSAYIHQYQPKFETKERARPRDSYRRKPMLDRYYDTQDDTPVYEAYGQRNEMPKTNNQYYENPTPTYRPMEEQARPDRQRRQKLRPWTRPQEKEIGFVIEEPIEEPQNEVHQPIFETNYNYANHFDKVKPFRDQPIRKTRPQYTGKTTSPRYPFLTQEHQYPRSEFTRPEFVHVQPQHNNDSPFDQQIQLFMQESPKLTSPQSMHVKPYANEPLRRQRPNYEGGVANEGSSYEDRRVMTPAYRRKYGQKKIPVQNKLPIYNNDGTQPIMNHNGPIFLASGGRPAEDEIQERFHTDRERNLKSFFTDHNLNDGGSRNEFRGLDSLPNSPQSLINEAFSRDDHEEEEDIFDVDSTPQNPSIPDGHEFPTTNPGRELAEGLSSSSGFHHDSNWDSFFNGHADNIEKDIHSLSRGTDGATAPPDYQQSEDQGQSQEEEEAEQPEYTDYETVPEVPNYREQQSYPDYGPHEYGGEQPEDTHQRQDPQQQEHVAYRDYDEYGQPIRGHEGNQDYHQYDEYDLPRSEQDHFEVPRSDDQGNMAEYVDYDLPGLHEGRGSDDHGSNDYHDEHHTGHQYALHDGHEGGYNSDEDYGHDDTMESRGSHQGSHAHHNNHHGNHDDFYKSDSNYFDAPDFDNFFTKVEGGVEDEITSSPNYYGSSRSQHDDWQREDERNHHHNNDNDPYQRSFDEVTYNDLRPDVYDNNHPDTLDFEMPSHDDLQKNYKTVSTSASEIREHVIEFNPREQQQQQRRTKIRRVKKVPVRLVRLASNKH